MVFSKTSVTLKDFHRALTYLHGLFFLQILNIKSLFYTHVVGATFSVNVFNDFIFKLDIFRLQVIECLGFYIYF